ncbi:MULTISPECIES: choline ABC transporter substrate-binding protein [unclassified Paracoccus (in: a-proteobacteria)]|uniref:choline ABC transporter substrate-binding protein n=1 Tax=unclassified Paracoccus (in: a-proteobacteria) TaxID=2688777 RepID=UPI0015FF0C6C|nr:MULTISPECIES: choline ABC transporter substrate-binding protein [unclassified Paracoccus (in: a-proteobacteria)]MBB1490488.1 choline ABC transporter substrate-binding protein [Paracoccus sp. MC1854]MBB1497331.1 choline ABC transporter substrate-binding protein [Paracoccus sp. MC1862]QQO44706.1 choline ABC transporter substrate-binding protein [Paracoccus sp. MC1862]
MPLPARSAALTAALALGLAAPALAEDASCETVRLSDPGWTDITATNGVAHVLLEALGYEPDVRSLSVPIGYEALKTAQIDAFLGNWMPAQQAFRADLDASGQVQELAVNLEGARFTLGVNAAGSALGITDFADLDAHRDAFEGRIYGIEPGAPANLSVAGMIQADKFGLGDWELVESSEQAMLAQVARNDSQRTPTVFLAWAPHPMNVAHEITWLTGGDAEFGPDFGGASVHTLARKEWVAQCPNAAKLLTQLTFDVDMENALMALILDGAMTGPQAAEAYLADKPDLIERWMAGVTTLEGGDGTAAVKEAVLK